MENEKPNTGSFRFKKFEIQHSEKVMKVGTDGVLLGAWTDLNESKKILDVGTGSGLIALMLAQRIENPATIIKTIDISEASFALAKYNFLQSPWAAQLKVYTSTYQSWAEKCKETYDLIVSNPPFFVNAYLSKEEHKNSMRHTQGLSFEDFIQSSFELMAPNGILSVILPVKEAKIFEKISHDRGLYCYRKTWVLGNVRKKKPIRVLLSFSKYKPSVLDESYLTIEGNKRHEYTSAYRHLTKEFYLNF